MVAVCAIPESNCKWKEWLRKFESFTFRMKRIKKILPIDYKFVPKDADANFDAKRNLQIVEDVIAETEKMWEAKKKESFDKIEERTDAVATYLHSLEQGKGNSNVEKYFGRKHLAYLRGQQIINELKKRVSQ